MCIVAFAADRTISPFLDDSAQDYVYSLLTGYVDPPPGVTVAEGMNYNPYFPGGGIAMGRVLYDGLVEYEDGTPSSTSQMAKDVVSFLSWTAEPELDERKKMGLQVSVFFGGRHFPKRYSCSCVVALPGRHHPVDLDCHQFVRKEGQVVSLEEQEALYVPFARLALLRVRIGTGLTEFTCV